MKEFRMMALSGLLGGVVAVSLLSCLGALPAAMVTFSAGTVASASDVNGNFTKLYTPLNGNIDNANVLDNSLTGQDFNTSSYLQCANLTPTATFRLPNTAGDPDAVTGAMKVNTTTSRARYYNGAALKTLAELESAQTFTTTQTFSPSDKTGIIASSDDDSMIRIRLASAAAGSGGDFYSGGVSGLRLGAGYTVVGGAEEATATNAEQISIGTTRVDFNQDSGLTFGAAWTPTTRISLSFAAGLQLKIAGQGIQIKEGTNATMGTLTANGATPVVVNTTKVTASSRIFCFLNTVGGTPGFGWVSARSAGTSFSFTGTAGDTSTWAWIIIEPS